MSNYNQIKNAAILAPTENTNLGSETNRYADVFLSGNVNIAGTSVNSTNVITPKVTSIGYVGDDTAADIAGGQTITLTGTGFAPGLTVLINGQPVSLVTFINSTSVSFTSPAMSAGGYVIYVINPDGGTALSIPGIQYSGVPSWSTSAGSLGSVRKETSFSATLSATGDAPLTYSVSSGALPTGISLNSTTGFISGTTPLVENITTYNFSIRASDAQSQDTVRNFSLTVIPSNPTTSAEVLIVGGGGIGGGNGGGGGGGGGLLLYGANNGSKTANGSAVSVSVATPYVITVGAGAVTNATQGASSSAFGYTAIGGGYGSSRDSGGPAGSGGSGGGGGAWASTNTTGKTPGAGTVGQGFIGASGPATDWLGDAAGSGGGGAASTGTVATFAQGGNGGAGYSINLSGSSVFYAGGGAGGKTQRGNGGTGGAGGGGNWNSTAGAPNTGGGGAGGSGGTPSYAAGQGGSGIVVLRYPDSYDAAFATTGSPTVTTSGGYRIYKFTSSGTITF